MGYIISVEITEKNALLEKYDTVGKEIKEESPEHLRVLPHMSLEPHVT